MRAASQCRSALLGLLPLHARALQHACAAAMFYSQFILAKQGPLGTIWVAAHSANAAKLRKSQIADTDLPGSCGARHDACLRRHTARG